MKHLGDIYTDSILIYGRLLVDSVLCYTHVKVRLRYGSEYMNRGVGFSHGK
jgi:hypothetical protein